MAENPEDINFPVSTVSRIIKEALPEGVIVSKEAKGAIGRAASIFVLYATTCANNHTLKAKRKTITPNDILQAVHDMEFDEFTPELKECLETFKKSQKDKKEAAADRKRSKQQQATVTTPTLGNATEQQIPSSSPQEPVFMTTGSHDNQEEMEFEESNNNSLTAITNNL